MKTIKLTGFFLFCVLMLQSADARTVAPQKTRQCFLLYREQPKVYYHSNIYTLPLPTYSPEEVRENTALMDRFRARILRDYEEKIYVNNLVFRMCQMENESNSRFEVRHAKELQEAKDQRRTLREINVN